MYRLWDTFYLINPDSDSTNKIPIAELMKRGDLLRADLTKQHDVLLNTMLNIDLHISDNELYISSIINQLALFAWMVEETRANTAAIETYYTIFDTELKLFNALYCTEQSYEFQPKKVMIFLNMMPAAVHKIYKSKSFVSKSCSKFEIYCHIFDEIYQHKKAYVKTIYEYGAYLIMQEKISKQADLVFA